LPEFRRGGFGSRFLGFAERMLGMDLVHVAWPDNGYRNNVAVLLSGGASV
jgi:hypothetical protein